MDPLKKKERKERNTDGENSEERRKKNMLTGERNLNGRKGEEQKKTDGVEKIMKNNWK